MSVGELVDVVEELQGFPPVKKWRCDELEQGLGKIGGDVWMRHRRAQRVWMRRLRDVAFEIHAQ